jgi:hypothetical protein
MNCLLLFSLLLQTRVVTRIAVTVPVDPASGLTAAAEPRSLAAILGFQRDTVNLTWTASPDLTTPAKSGSGYAIWRAAGASSSAFSRINATLATTPIYKDTTPNRHVMYRYYVVAMIGQVPAVRSNIVNVLTP